MTDVALLIDDSAIDTGWVSSLIRRFGEISYPELQRRFRAEFGFHSVARLDIALGVLMESGGLLSRLAECSEEEILHRRRHSLAADLATYYSFSSA